jgi:NADPH:quinone reductase
VVADLGTAGGGYAEFALARADSLLEIPWGMSDDHAVAMVGTGRTAMSVLEIATPTATDVVLVTAAASGIGALLVQALRAAGATVIGVAGGSAKVSVVERVGSSVAIDYSVPGWEDAVRSSIAGRPITLALDGVGGSIGRSALELLAPGGRLVMFGTASGAPTAMSAADLYSRGISVATAIATRLLQRPGGLRPLERRALAAAASGDITPLVGHTYALADAAAAHRAIEARATTGKVVLHTSGTAGADPSV